MFGVGVQDTALMGGITFVTTGLHAFGMLNSCDTSRAGFWHVALCSDADSLNVDIIIRSLGHCWSHLFLQLISLSHPPRIHDQHQN